MKHDLSRRECSECRNALPSDPRRVTCSNACRRARQIGGRRAGADSRRVRPCDVMRLLNITNRELRYWLKHYVPHKGERPWGQPQLAFPDVFWLAYIVSSQKAGVPAPRAGKRGIPRIQELLKTWNEPFSQTTLCEVDGVLFLARGRFSVEGASPGVLVDGPHLARSILLRHKRRPAKGKPGARSLTADLCPNKGRLSPAFTDPPGEKILPCQERA